MKSLGFVFIVETKITGIVDVIRSPIKRHILETLFTCGFLKANPVLAAVILF